MGLFEDFVDILKKFGLEYFQRYYGHYTGIVVSNNEDQLKRGTVTIKVPTLMRERILSKAAEPIGFDLAGPEKGQFFPPDVGDHITVVFENGDINHPMYFGGYYARGELPEDFKNGYPNVRGWVFKNGTKILIDENEGKEAIKIISKDKNGKESSIVMESGEKKLTIKSQQEEGEHSVSFTPEGMAIQVKGNASVNVEGTADITTTDNITVTTAKDASVKAVNINAEATGEIEFKASAKAKFFGTSETELGAASGITKVQGSLVQLGGGGLPVARVGDFAVGQGNLGVPIVAYIATGSPKVVSG